MRDPFCCKKVEMVEQTSFGCLFVSLPVCLSVSLSIFLSVCLSRSSAQLATSRQTYSVPSSFFLFKSKTTPQCLWKLGCVFKTLTRSQEKLSFSCLGCYLSSSYKYLSHSLTVALSLDNSYLSSHAEYLILTGCIKLTVSHLCLLLTVLYLLFLIYV